MLYTIKYRLNLIMVYFTFTIHKLGFLSITRICKFLMAMKWISCKINHYMFRSFHCLIQNLECRGICEHQINSSFFYWQNEALRNELFATRTKYELLSKLVHEAEERLHASNRQKQTMEDMLYKQCKLTLILV